ncbi:exodeoxyribonuclease I [Candidatus Ishikawella capsulata]|uniref:exodeoxyribonuclease I n=1 Tax=Candidatus Ishikawella capsulata TaxID=168169 RepID=UPI00059749CE|nr:exodeoxyribonuclease I [Candidatus Ishikawaella capsulata]
MQKITQTNFLFYDYETFGKNTSLDRPAQFASLRTDINFNIIEKPQKFFCKLADDYLPQPEAVMVTGITPQIVQNQGVPEVEFAKRIHSILTKSNTCIIGYNNIHFDDEMTRNIFYRNFYDPYAWTWKNNNSRWDLLNVMRTCYALRPNGIIWPKRENGLPSFRLEHLTKANGITHNKAHDAISDVHATVELAKLVKKKQPNLFDFLFNHRQKQQLRMLIDLPHMQPLVYVSNTISTLQRNTSLVAPICWHPHNFNYLIIIDLTKDVSVLLDIDIKTLRKNIYKSSLFNEIIPTQVINLNKCPILAPANTLRIEDTIRLNIDRQQCIDNLLLLRKSPNIRNKILEIHSQFKPKILSNNVDTQLYKGFFNNFDQVNMKIIHKTEPINLRLLNIQFNDKRLDKLLFRYRARNFPKTLSNKEKKLWFQHKKKIFHPKYIHDFLCELRKLTVKNKNNINKIFLLKELYAYLCKLHPDK